MALNLLAPIGVRPDSSRRRDWLWILPLVAMAGALVGCSGRRQTMRPIYAAPTATLGRPCTNCGTGAGSSSTVIEGSDLGPVGPSGGTSSSSVVDGPIDVPTSSTSVVPKLPRSSGTRSSAVESSPSASDETPPKASIDADPEFTPSSTTVRSRMPNPSAKPINPSSAPDLTGPNTGVAPKSSSISADGRTARLDSNATGRIRRTSLSADLRPYLDNSTASELAFPARADRPWKYIVLHHSAHEKGSYEEIDREHRKVLGYEGCGYHFVIGNGTGSDDGEIDVAQRWINQKHGVHCRNANSSDMDEYGIGICLVGDFEQQKPTARQVAATKALVSYLSGRYNIAEAKVETHSHIASTPTVCPGKFFPTDSLLTSTKPSTASVIERRDAVPTSWRAVRRAKTTY